MFLTLKTTSSHLSANISFLWKKRVDLLQFWYQHMPNKKFLQYGECVFVILGHKKWFFQTNLANIEHLDALILLQIHESYKDNQSKGAFKYIIHW